MKFQLVNERNYRQDGVQDFQADFECKVLEAGRVSVWEKNFAMQYPIGMGGEVGYDFAPHISNFMYVGRNHKEEEPYFWSREVEIFKWYIEIFTLEVLMDFMNEWTCTLDYTTFYGRFSG